MFFHPLNTYLYAISELSLLSLKVQCTVEVKIWHELCNIFKILIILPKKEGSYKMPYLFILVLTWIRYFKWKMFTYSPKEKIIIEFIKMIPFKSTWLIINTLAYLNPLQQWLYDFEIHLFTPRAVTDITIGYYRRFKHSLMLQMRVLTVEQN